MKKLTGQIKYDESEEIWDDSSLDTFEKEIIAAANIAMGALSDTIEGVEVLRNANETIKTQPSLITTVIASLNHYAQVLLAMSNSGESKLELSNGWDLDTRGVAELLVEGSRVFNKLQEGKLIV